MKFTCFRWSLNQNCICAQIYIFLWRMINKQSLINSHLTIQNTKQYKVNTISSRTQNSIMQHIQNVFGFVKKMTDKIIYPSSTGTEQLSRGFKKSKSSQSVQGQCQINIALSDGVGAHPIKFNAGTGSRKAIQEKPTNNLSSNTFRNRYTPSGTLPAQKSRHILAPQWLIRNEKPVDQNKNFVVDSVKNLNRVEKTHPTRQGSARWTVETKRQKMLQKQQEKANACLVCFDEQFVKFPDMNGDDISSIAPRSETADSVDPDLNEFISVQEQAAQIPQFAPARQSVNRQSTPYRGLPGRQGRRQLSDSFIARLKRRASYEQNNRLKEQLRRRQEQRLNPSKKPVIKGDRPIRIHHRHRQQKMLKQRIRYNERQNSNYMSGDSSSQSSDSSDSDSEHRFGFLIDYGDEPFEPVLAGISNSSGDVAVENKDQDNCGDMVTGRKTAERRVDDAEDQRENRENQQQNHSKCQEDGTWRKTLKKVKTQQYGSFFDKNFSMDDE